MLRFISLITIVLISFNFVLSTGTLNLFNPGELPPNINCGESFFSCMIFLLFKVFYFAIYFTIALAIIFFAWGGVEYVIYGSDSNRRKEAGQRLIWSLVGLVVAFSSYTAVFLVKNIVFFNFNNEGGGAEDGNNENDYFSSLGSGVAMECMTNFNPDFNQCVEEKCKQKCDFIFGPSVGDTCKTKCIDAAKGSEPINHNFKNNLYGERKISLPIEAFVYAQNIVPRIPTSLKCGDDGVELKSILASSSYDNSSGSRNIWRQCLDYYSLKFLSFFYGLALFLSVIFLIFIGILYITSPQKVKDIHPRVFYIVIGLIIAVLSFTIIKIVSLFFKE